MADLTDAQLDDFERTLLVQRSRLDTELRRMAGSLADVQEARSDANADDEHDPEGGTMSAEWSRIAGVHTELGRRMDALGHALDRLALRDGTFGTCARCGRPIGTARLEALPAADLCIDCARAAAR